MNRVCIRIRGMIILMTDKGPRSTPGSFVRGPKRANVFAYFFCEWKRIEDFYRTKRTCEVALKAILQAIS